jgi:hypothetical protein
MLVCTNIRNYTATSPLLLCQQAYAIGEHHVHTCCVPKCFDSYWVMFYVLCYRIDNINNVQALIVTLRPGALTPPLDTDAVMDGASLYTTAVLYTYYRIYSCNQTLLYMLMQHNQALLYILLHSCIWAYTICLVWQVSLHDHATHSNVDQHCCCECY